MFDALVNGRIDCGELTFEVAYYDIEELNRRVLMSLVDRILIHENHAIEIVFKYRTNTSRRLNTFSLCR